jgi:hypothetical protein
MAKKAGPYVGVTGFMSRVEVNEALAMIPEGSKRRLMVGVLMSSKTLAGETNKWPGRYPKKDAVADIFVDDPRALNLIHYNTDNPNNLCTELRRIVELAGSHLDGFQLNIAWPAASQIELFHEAFPDLYLLLQIGGKAMEQVGDSAGRLIDLIGSYVPMIDAVLIDPSGGKGEPFDVQKAAMFLRVIRRDFDLGLGLAGGLGPDTLHSLDPFIKEFPDLSIDAEGRLRIPKPDDALSIGAVRDYLDDAFPILAGKELPGIKLRRACVAYGFTEHVRRYGLGDNMLRTPHLAQPCALQVGDILATGDRVLSPPREDYNGSILIHLTGGFDGHWIKVAGRLPIALLTKEDDAPPELWESK